MFRTFCEEMERDSALVLTMLEDFGHTSTRTGRLNRAAARMRHDIELYGECNPEDVLATCDLDQLTDAEIAYINERLNSNG